MRTGIKVAVGAAAAAIAAWSFLGVEVTSVDHETKYAVFVKSYPSRTVFFQSYMGCDECDATDFRALSSEQQAQFAEFCRAKYGFGDPRICNAIYAEQQRVSMEAIGGNDAQRALEQGSMSGMGGARRLGDTGTGD